MNSPMEPSPNCGGSVAPKARVCAPPTALGNLLFPASVVNTAAPGPAYCLFFNWLTSA